MTREQNRRDWTHTLCCAFKAISRDLTSSVGEIFDLIARNLISCFEELK